MKRGLRIALFILASLIVTTGLTFAAVEPVTLKLDGNTIETEVPPTIISGRTMVPAKFLFEAMGGTVAWLEDTRQVKVELGNTEVMVTIDSTTALVNENPVSMDVAPTIINRRTLIPAALVAEQLGCKVNWDNDTRTAEIFTPEKTEDTEAVKITSIETEERDDGVYRIMVIGDGELDTYNGKFYGSPDRYVLDISNSALEFGIEDAAEGVEGFLTFSNAVFGKVRFSQFDSSTVRVVADLNNKADGEVSLSDDGTAIYIDLWLKEGGGDDAAGDSNGGTTSNPGNPADLNGLNIPMLDAAMTDKLIIIDPGHGGSDSGSLGKDSSGAIIQMEKDLNLAIALRLNDLLKAAGAKTFMLREDDSSIALYDRPAKANELNGDLYVSVHNNSNESSTPNGTETHYYNKKMEEDYGYESKDIADSIQAEIAASIGLKDRGTKSSPSLAVLNKSNMPAIIIEGAFLSNPTELTYMMTDQFKEAYATGAARGIIKALNASAANK